MIARTKFQKEVVEYGMNMPALPPKKVVEWVKRKAFNHYAFRLKSGKTVCMDCGAEFYTDENKHKARCPHCHTTLQVENTRKTTHIEKSYFSYMTIVKGYQVVRSYRLDANYHKGKRPDFRFYEICRHFINDKGKIMVIGLPKTIMSGCIDGFAIHCGEMDLRNDSYSYRYVASQWICPYGRIAPFMKKHGFNGKFGECNVIDLIERVLTEPKFETIMKNGDIDFLSFMMNCRCDNVYAYWAEYKVAHRNHYKFTDVSLWVDLVDMLRYCGRDTHNPHYICPEDLNAAHDYWHKKREQLYNKRKEEDERKKAKVEQARYVQIKSKYFGLNISNNLIDISVLNNVDDFYRLGKEMHICLGQMQYYKKDSSLILLAKVEGKIMEVIELSLDTLTVIQSRSYCNQPSEYHDQIVSLVKANVGLVAKLRAA